MLYPLHIHNELDDGRDIIFYSTSKTSLCTITAKGDELEQGDLVELKIYDRTNLPHPDGTTEPPLDSQSQPHMQTRDSQSHSVSSPHIGHKVVHNRSSSVDSPTDPHHLPPHSLGTPRTAFLMKLNSHPSANYDPHNANANANSSSQTNASQANEGTPLGSLPPQLLPTITYISIAKPIADLYDLTTSSQVSISLFAPSRPPTSPLIVAATTAATDFVTLTIKDQHLSRSDMYLLKNALLGHWMYVGQTMSVHRFRVTVQSLSLGGRTVKSGVVVESTVVTFRTKSSRIIWLVQMSAELWDTARHGDDGGDVRRGGNECDLNWDKFVAFLEELFRRWKVMDVSHSISIIFFSRTYVSGTDSPSACLSRESDGRLYEDHYKPVLENVTASDWMSLVYQVKLAFTSYPSDVGWKITNSGCRVPSLSKQGNLLEAINTTLNVLQYHYMDRDLTRTGNSIVVVSPGSGVFEVDKSLANITRQRMMDCGVGSDCICLALPPLHVTPFFVYKKSKEEEETDKIWDEGRVEEWKRHFECPHWLNVCFVDYDYDEGEDEQGPASPLLPSTPEDIAKYGDDRDFYEILAAVRPRRGGIPPALLSLLGYRKEDAIPAKWLEVQQQNNSMSGFDFGSFGARSYGEGRDHLAGSHSLPRNATTMSFEESAGNSSPRNISPRNGSHNDLAGSYTASSFLSSRTFGAASPPRATSTDSNSPGGRGNSSPNTRGNSPGLRGTSPGLRPSVIPRAKVNSSSSSSSNGAKRAARKLFKMNPFRKQDELELLSKRTHNRRRWSHVFPQGVEEFKRHAPINWTSLCQPAILPLTTDFYPNDESLRRDYQVSQYNVTLDQIDTTQYPDHTALLSELIMQRLTRDLQIVPAFAMTRNSKRMVQQVEDGRRFILSMGHRINEIYYNQEDDLLEVTQYLAKYAKNDHEKGNTQVYRYRVYNKAQRTFIVNKQTFSRFASTYPWNPVDNVICAASEMALTEEMRYRRVLFALIPQYQIEGSGDQGALRVEYREKFKKLIDYLSNRSGGKILIAYHEDNAAHNQDEGGQNAGRGGEWERETNRITLNLNEKKRGGKVRNEWAIMTMNKGFNPKRVFRISIQWLCASAPRIESEVKTLNRRCGQFGLSLHQFPETSVNSNMYLHAFISPPVIIIGQGGQYIEEKLLADSSLGFVDDGYRQTDYDIEGLEGFTFNRRRKYSYARKAPGRQIVYYSGQFFVRFLRDALGKTALFYVDNRMQSEQAKSKGAEFNEFKELVEKYRQAYMVDVAEERYQDRYLTMTAGESGVAEQVKPLQFAVARAIPIAQAGRAGGGIGARMTSASQR